ncbi:MAG: putative toxin-antitoxin system toxin component, PIN family [Solirubrobacterales bacterium]|nr:putative toxin-antitoxin system toxin component, PIN family [Solirubrobacterales bacterium]
MTRVVIDASVLASAAVAHPNSPSSRLIDAAKAGEVDVVACARLLAELQRALTGRYFRDRMVADDRLAFEALLREIAGLLPDPDDPPRLLRDPRDDYIVALARAASVDAIVTGDKDLLDHAGLGPRAITPREACEHFGLT